MNYENAITALRQVEALLLSSTPTSVERSPFPKLDLHDRMLGIVGPRGVGKTTLMLQLLKRRAWDSIIPDTPSPNTLYFSADSVTLNDGDLLGLATHFYLKQLGRVLLIDEVHKFTNWQQELKNVYDSLPEIRIIFSGSSSTSLLKGKYDLSRRAVTHILPGLSFREYLNFHDFDLKPIELSYLLENYQTLSQSLGTKEILFHLKNYLTYGYYPYFLENTNVLSIKQKVLAALEKSIYEDISSQHRIESTNLRYFKKILSYLSLISPGESSVNKISSTIGKNNVTVTQYLDMLADAYLIRYLPGKVSATQSLKERKKIFLDNNTQARFLAENAGGTDNIGTIRELFVLSHLQNASYQPHFSETGDLVLGETYFEIGGKNKTPAQLKGVKSGYVVADDILVAGEGKIPMYLFGMLY